MAQVINTNVLSLVTQNNLNRSQGVLGTAIERLSSGARINSAKDDAAGQAIANRFTANVKGLTQASRNASDAISIAQVTEGAVNEINDNLQRIRELAVQAQNSTNSESDRSSIKEEVDQRLKEIDRISEQTQFNGIKVLSGDSKMTFQVGANDGETIDIDLKKVDRDTLGLKSLDVAAGKFGWAVSASDFESLVKGTGTDAEAKQAVEDGINGIKLGADDVTDAKIYYQTDANGVVDKSKVYIQGKINGKDVELKAGVSATAKTATDDAKLEFTGVAELDAADKKALADKGPLGTLDKALSKIDTQRSQLGAFQNRMQSTINNLNNSVNNLSAARSRIQDADFAVEVSNMSRGQILQQAGTSVLAQANQVPQSVLSLLR
ncbi:FliC/FljB family flagellin [Morganella morganii]|uniref:FliC/FljB family flagellin n=2 Tax=Morganella morganii TaxID=582 RepID=UPI0012999EDE|nr:FliC/FljB family flagellin [Morganella morganii]MBT0381391.1 FliC/FljB family flagellin [Morganella morganii subsp. morganii]MBT0419772.1 FliC/FljB family flagellin [Morganella morganii subsp. morganii]MBT0514722.1 FliC/FljB family flagellin [Morganella morganii subsp. morganii]MRE58255.1 FliC/FljB family flagellin [Morganella morganii]QWM02846.1 FliC/FljB family flagellin [Morganella morganii subsp. morganii]